MRRRLPHPIRGEVSVVGGAVRLSATPLRIERAPRCPASTPTKVWGACSGGVVGAAASDLGRTGMSALALLEQAMRRAVDDAGLTMKEIDGLICRGPDDIYTHHQRMGRRLGINARFSTSLDNGGASQILAVILAVMAIDAGLCTTVLCGYGRDSWTRTHRSSESRT